MGIVQRDIVNSRDENNGTFIAKLSSILSRFNFVKPVVHIFSYPLTVCFLSGREELRRGASVRQVLLHPYGNQDLSPTCHFFQSLR